MEPRRCKARGPGSLPGGVPTTGKQGTLTSPRGVLAKHRRSPPPPRDTNPSSVICWRSSTCKRQCPDPARVAPSGDARVARQPNNRVGFRPLKDSVTGLPPHCLRQAGVATCRRCGPQGPRLPWVDHQNRVGIRPIKDSVTGHTQSVCQCNERAQTGTSPPRDGAPELRVSQIRVGFRPHKDSVAWRATSHQPAHRPGPARAFGPPVTAR